MTKSKMKRKQAESTFRQAAVEAGIPGINASSGAGKMTVIFDQSRIKSVGSLFNLLFHHMKNWKFSLTTGGSSSQKQPEYKRAPFAAGKTKPMKILQSNGVGILDGEEFSKGGMVYASNGMLIPYRPQGTDTVPAMLTR